MGIQKDRHLCRPLGKIKKYIAKILFRAEKNQPQHKKIEFHNT